MIHAYTAWLHDTGHPLEELLPGLTTSELAEMQQFRNVTRVRSFSLSRLMLRRLIQEHLPEAAEVALTRESSGRLVMTGVPGWHISLSHCPGRIAVILAEAPCGVDIEVFRKVDWQRIARRYFAREEQEWLQSLPVNEASLAFLRLWTLKEAGVKAMGKGLANHLASLAFDLSGERPCLAAACPHSGIALQQVIGDAHILAAASMTDQPVNWQLCQLTAEMLHVSA